MAASLTDRKVRPSLIADLCAPENYPAPQPRSVSLVTTHGSWVFLTDDEAWKVKRPVDYGFMDFSTIEKRRHFCEEEVRLNRRLAPDVYRGVSLVWLDDRGHSFSRPGEVVDYAVRMKRLPDWDSAEAMLSRRELKPIHLRVLAGLLARFYRDAAETPKFGTAGVVRFNVRENFDQVRAFIGRFVDQSTFRGIQGWQEAFLAEHPERFAARVGAHRIRDGHGDLRLEHVYFTDSGPLVIDCIEFNDRFRCGDAASDAAFLAMELAYRGRPDLASLFLARFAMESADFDLYSVVDFYLSYRAWVRGKIACFVASDRSTPIDKIRRKAEEASALFEQAKRHTRSGGGAPWVIVVGGLIGSGKSTLAEALSMELGWPVVRSDVLRKHLGGIAPIERGGPDLYTGTMTRRTYEEMIRSADTVLGAGRGIVLDATFSHRWMRDLARDLASRHGVSFLMAETKCDEATARSRLRLRDHEPSVSDAREDLYLSHRGGFEEMAELSASQHMVIDTTHPPASGLRQVLARLKDSHR